MIDYIGSYRGKAENFFALSPCDAFAEKHEHRRNHYAKTAELMKGSPLTVMPRKNRSNQDSKALLLNAFINLMQTIPYDSINVTTITSKAGVSRMAYYRNYTSKEKILTSYLDETASAVALPLNDYLPTPHTPTEYIVLLFKRLTADAYTNNYNLGLALRNARLGDIFLDNIKKNLKNYFPNAEDVSVAMYAGTFYGIYMQWSEESEPDTATLLADALTEFLVKR